MGFYTLTKNCSQVLKEAAISLVTDKVYNCGQICLSPDTVLVPKNKGPKFIQYMKDEMLRRWGPATSSGVSPCVEHNQWCGIITQRHYERIVDLVTDAQGKNAQVISLDPAGACPEFTFTKDNAGRKLPLQAVLNPPPHAKICDEEIFGPVFCVFDQFESLDEQIRYSNLRSEPLASYVFTHDACLKAKLMREVRCGGMTINSTMKHTSNPELPFGGLGKSGFGYTHGKYSLQAFSHKMAVCDSRPVGLMGKIWQKIGPDMTLPASPSVLEFIKKAAAPGATAPNFGMVARVVRVTFHLCLVGAAIGVSYGFFGVDGLVGAGVMLGTGVLGCGVEMLSRCGGRVSGAKEMKKKNA